jgi:LacI family transcriptional regulator, repressor for deo operon, udp, cdd, tsx, nupC, and nupG
MIGDGLITTIKDVAVKAGVSVATISRVINKSNSVKEETKQLVLDVIKEMNYEPNSMGRNLRTQKTKMILVIINSLSNDFHAKVIRGIEHVGGLNNYNVMIVTTYNDKNKEKVYLELLKNKQVDGAIFTSTTLSNAEMQKLGEDYKILQCGEYIDDINVPYVSIDNYLAAYDATKYLISMNKKNILYVSVNNKYISTTLRLKGYRQALLDNGFKVNKNNIIKCDYGFKKAYSSMNVILKAGNIPDAVFAISDRMAAGIIKSVIDNGYRVPEDIVVMGFDNINLTKMYNPSISTVSQLRFNLGSIACQKLITIIDGEEFENKTIIKHKLVLRDSTKSTL